MPLLSPLAPALARTLPSPVVEAKKWIAGIEFAADRPLLNVSQAAPAAAPPLPLRAEIARVAMEVETAHLYGAVLGLPELRVALAGEISATYGGAVAPKNVAITAGCNEAFAAALASLAGPGDEVILPAPWYFNHRMWLEMSGVTTVPLLTGDELLPSVAEAERLITDKTRAIVLVTPNNPCGVEYPADLLAAFHALARARGITLVVDETYRDFDSRPTPAHGLFRAPDWDESFIHLYSFSKAYRLTGHRVGALVASPARLAEVEKFLDTVTICPNQIGQYAALFGIETLGPWLAGERAEILARRGAMEAGFATLPGWRLLGAGAYFAYVEHPFAEGSDALCRRMVTEAGVLALPGTFFMPEGDAAGARQLRIAFANIDKAGIATLFERLAGLDGKRRA